MQTIHAVLGLPQLYRDALVRNLNSEFEISVVEEPVDEWSIACTLRRLLNREVSNDDLFVLITTMDESTRIPSYFARLLTEFPEISVMGICRNSSHVRSFQLRIHVQEVYCSLSGLSDAILACTRHSLPW